MHEIVTFQLGAYSNHLGAHYWNFKLDELNSHASSESMQDECDDSQDRNTSRVKEVFFQASNSSRNSTEPVPRLISFGAKGSLQRSSRTAIEHQSDQNKNIEREIQQTQWSGKVETYDQSAPYVDDESMNSAARFRSWNSFFLPTTHRKSLMEVAEFQSFDPLHNFAEGNWASQGKICSSTVEEVEDRIRFFLEDCDSVQGFQCFVDTDSAWGGFADSLMEYVKEECPSAAVLCVANDFKYPMDGDVNQLIPTEQSKRKCTMDINAALSTAKLSEHSNMFIPLTLPNHLTNTQLYEGSATSAAAVYAATSVYYNPQSDTPIGLKDYIQSVVVSSSCPLVELSAQFDLYRDDEMRFPKDMETWTAKHSFLQRPAIKNRKKEETVVKYWNQWLSSNSVQDSSAWAMEMALLCRNHSPYQHSRFSSTNSARQVPKFFPCTVFDHDEQRSSTGGGVLSALSQVSTSSRVSQYISDLSVQYRPLKKSRLSINDYLQCGMEIDEFEETDSQLYSFLEQFDG